MFPVASGGITVHAAADGPGAAPLSTLLAVLAAVVLAVPWAAFASKASGARRRLLGAMIGAMCAGYLGLSILAVLRPLSRTGDLAAGGLTVLVGGTLVVIGTLLARTHVISAMGRVLAGVAVATGFLIFLFVPLPLGLLFLVVGHLALIGCVMRGVWNTTRSDLPEHLLSGSVDDRC